MPMSPASASAKLIIFTLYCNCVRCSISSHLFHHYPLIPFRCTINPPLHPFIIPVIPLPLPPLPSSFSASSSSSSSFSHHLHPHNVFFSNFHSVSSSSSASSHFLPNGLLIRFFTLLGLYVNFSPFTISSPLPQYSSLLPSSVFDESPPILPLLPRRSWQPFSWVSMCHMS